jgi:predicted flavoprotein YhiN
VSVRCEGLTFHEKLLFTHRGLSGPAILQASSYWKWKSDEPLTIDLAPNVEWTAALRDGPGRRDIAAARTALRTVLPQRLADRWLEIAERCGRASDWSNAGLAAQEKEFHSWQLRPSGTEGYEKAEVTAGGVDTTELSSKTMESARQPGLFFVGEVVDVTGWLGGFNFQWAWASGAAAGRALWMVALAGENTRSDGLATPVLLFVQELAARCLQFQLLFAGAEFVRDAGPIASDCQVVAEGGSWKGHGAGTCPPCGLIARHLAVC